jgi:hypothetical protein
MDILQLKEAAECFFNEDITTLAILCDEGKIELLCNYLEENGYDSDSAYTLWQWGMAEKSNNLNF